jgi:hypothetical protein
MFGWKGMPEYLLQHFVWEVSNWVCESPVCLHGAFEPVTPGSKNFNLVVERAPRVPVLAGEENFEVD